MPVFLLRVRMELTNIVEVALKAGAALSVNVELASGDERSGVVVDPAEEVELSNGRSTANLVMKDGTKEAYIKVLGGHEAVKAYTEEDRGAFIAVAAFECRGLAVTGWSLGSEWTATSEQGSTFDEVDLEGDEDGWFDFCEKGECEVSITELKTSVDRC